MAGSRTNRPYRSGAAVAGIASFLIVWSTIVHDGDDGMSYFLVIMAAVVGGSAARFQPAGLARAMMGTAVMQALLGVATATAPIVANAPNGSLNALLYNGFFVAWWLAAALCFAAGTRRAADTLPA